MMEWNEIKKLLEPVTLGHYTEPSIHVQISIAISLKRIADSLEKPKVQVQSYVGPNQSARND